MKYKANVVYNCWSCVEVFGIEEFAEGRESGKISTYRRSSLRSKRDRSFVNLHGKVSLHVRAVIRILFGLSWVFHRCVIYYKGIKYQSISD